MPTPAGTDAIESSMGRVPRLSAGVRSGHKALSYIVGPEKFVFHARNIPPGVRRYRAVRLHDTADEFTGLHQVAAPPLQQQNPGAKKPDHPQQESQIVASRTQHRMDGIAHGALQPAPSHPTIFLEMPDDRFNGRASLHHRSLSWCHAAQVLRHAEDATGDSPAAPDRGPHGRTAARHTRSVRSGSGTVDHPGHVAQAAQDAHPQEAQVPHRHSAVHRPAAHPGDGDRPPHARGLQTCATCSLASSASATA